MANFIGNKPNQVPTNGDLGTLAFQDASNPNLGAVVAEGLTVDTTTLVVDAVNNRVGIGTASPNQKLSVAGIIQSESSGNGIQIQQSAQDGYINMTGTGFISFRNGASYTDRMKLDSSGNLGLGVTPSAWLTGKAIQFGASSSLFDYSATGNRQTHLINNSYLNASAIYAYLNTDAATRYTQVNGQHQWLNAPSGTAGAAVTFTQAMTLDASGQLIVGGTTALATSANRGNITINGTSGSILTLGVGGVYKAYLYSSGTNLTLNNSSAGYISFENNTAERMRIDSSGNVGIGTSTPSTGTLNRQLTINSGASSLAGIVLQNNATGTAFNDGFQIYLNGTTGTLSLVENSPMTFEVNGSERMRIDSSGNLLVGTTAQIATTTSRVNILNADAGISGLTIGNAGGSTNTNCILFSNSNGIVGTIRTNGSATAYNTSSDYRLKENIAPMIGALDVVQQLKPVTYNWKTDGSSGQGFIAHELQAVVPDCVTGEKDAVNAEGKPVYQGIDVSFLVATLTKAIQEQQALIENLTTRLTALEGN